MISSDGGFVSSTLILILSLSEFTEVWVAVEDKLEVSTISTKDDVSSFSSTHLLDSLPAKHIIGKYKSSQYFHYISARLFHFLK